MMNKHKKPYLVQNYLSDPKLNRAIYCTTRKEAMDVLDSFESGTIKKRVFYDWQDSVDSKRHKSYTWKVIMRKNFNGIDEDEAAWALFKHQYPY